MKTKEEEGKKLYLETERIKIQYEARGIILIVFNGNGKESIIITNPFVGKQKTVYLLKEFTKQIEENLKQRQN